MTLVMVGSLSMTLVTLVMDGFASMTRVTLVTDGFASMTLVTLVTEGFVSMTLVTLVTSGTVKAEKTLFQYIETGGIALPLDTENSPFVCRLHNKWTFHWTRKVALTKM